VVKRAIDIVGSAFFLLVLSPVIALIAAIIKLTSEGPAVFKQERLGQDGARFMCLKFRTMYNNNDSCLHKEFVKKLIESGHGGGEQRVYKITNDLRVTPVGGFLRKFSLDELPQFWNVLRGEMSLVGPRPPVPYECQMYKPWHRRRLDTKPGITGLWQVSGRSSLSFDDMVRLDIHYCENQSLWMDMKIIAATPYVVLAGKDAY
jgi:lipopolysaccharide/colanic/teichoic acid biosynthesis glycosyltransferase